MRISRAPAGSAELDAAGPRPRRSRSLCRSASSLRWRQGSGSIISAGSATAGVSLPVFFTGLLSTPFYFLLGWAGAARQA